MNLFSQIDPKTFWNAPNGSAELWIKIAVTLALGIALIFGLMSAPPKLRRFTVIGVTFLSGLFYFLLWAYPAPMNRAPNDAPRNALEGVSFWLNDAQAVVANLTNIIAAFLIGLGIYSLLRIHLRKVFKQQADWGFSLALVVSLFGMTLFGYWAWIQKTSPGSTITDYPGPNWGFAQYSRDLLFDGLLQQMDAAMFSLIAFFILSAAYRAFRARSVEATILLIAALILILSLLGMVEFEWNQGVDWLAHGDKNSLVQNLQLTEIAGWLKNTFQTSSIRGLDFGVGIGLVAMALRLWLSLEPIGGEF